MNLAGQALDWYNNLPQHSIFSFEKLANQFMEYFGIKIKKRVSIIDLSNFYQFFYESILDYLCW